MEKPTEEELATLPKIGQIQLVGDASENDDIVWRICHYSERDTPYTAMVKDEHLLQSQRERGEAGVCPGCAGILTVVDVYEGEHGLVSKRHLVRLYNHQIAEERIRDMAILLGMDPGSDDVLKAYGAMRDERSDSVDTQVVVGMSYLQMALQKRAAAQMVVKAVEELGALTLDFQDAPFFTEATLYELVGKEQARTLLAYFGKLKQAVGA